MSWRRVFPLALLLGARAVLCQSSADLIQSAITSNREIQAARQRVEEARGMLRQAGVRPAPTIEASAATGRPLRTQGEEEYTVGIAQPIETGGKRGKRRAVAEQGVRLAEAELNALTQRITFEIRTRYTTAVASERKVAALDRVIAVNRESLRLMEARVKRGDAAPLERQLLKVELSRVESQRATALGESRSARLELMQVAGAVPETLTGEAAATPGLPLDELRRRALEARAELRIARTLESQSAAELDLVDAQARPDVTASAQYARRNSQFDTPVLLRDRDDVLTLGVSIPIETRRRNRGNMEAAVARQRAAELRRRHLEITIPLEVESAWQKLEAARGSLELLRGGVLEESRKNLAVIRQAYALGQLRLLDVLNEQRRLLETEINFIDAEAGVARGVAELERAVGGEWK